MIRGRFARLGTDGLECKARFRLLGPFPAELFIIMRFLGIVGLFFGNFASSMMPKPAAQPPRLDTAPCACFPNPGEF